MESKLANTLIILGLLVGVALGAMAFPTEKVVISEKLVPGETVYKDSEPLTVEVKVFEPSLLLDPAIADFLDELDDNDNLVCNDDEYNFDEVSVSKLYDEYAFGFDDEDYTVEFSVRLAFDEFDERSCKETYDVLVFYEEDEKPEVSY